MFESAFVLLTHTQVSSLLSRVFPACSEIGTIQKTSGTSFYQVEPQAVCNRGSLFEIERTSEPVRQLSVDNGMIPKSVLSIALSENAIKRAG